MIKTFLHKFKNNEDGVISVEFALIAPMLIFATLFAINLGYQVNKHQKLASSIAAGNNYIQDYIMHQDLSNFRSVYDWDTGERFDGTPVETAKLVIQSAYGNDLDLSEININTACACPTNANTGSGDSDNYGEATEGGGQHTPIDFTDPNTEFYSVVQLWPWKTGELCVYQCPNDGGLARVIVEIEVDHVIQDLFSKEITIQESLKARMR